MLVNLFGSLYGPEVIAAFSGALLFTIIQKTFNGLNKIIIFIVSFLMGIVGADSALAIITSYIQIPADAGREIGAFVCSMLVVTVAISVLGRFEKTSNTGESLKKQDEGKNDE